MEEIDFNLPSLRELRAYYAALPVGEEFPGYTGKSCLIARPVNEKIARDGDFIIIRPGDDDEGGQVEIETQTGTTVVSDELDESLAALARAFDHRNWTSGRCYTRNLTYGECVALIDEYIAIYPEA